VYEQARPRRDRRLEPCVEPDRIGGAIKSPLTVLDATRMPTALGELGTATTGVP
jgi:hypothetical protein